jgi:hypothetical protein
MKNSKKLMLILLILSSSLVLAGCTSSTEDALDEVEQRVEIIDNNADFTFSGEDTVNDEDVIDEEEIVEEEVIAEEPEIDEEELPEEVEEPVVEEYSSEATYDGAVNSDNIRIVGYNYYWEGGQLIYEWTFKSGDAAKLIASYSAGYDSEDNLVVEFSSLTMDYVAVDGETVVLGSTLPELMTSREGIKSGYVFQIGSENEFEFSISGEKLILKLDI